MNLPLDLAEQDGYIHNCEHNISQIKTLLELQIMAKNPPVGDGHRHGAVKDRSQVYNPTTGHWTKRGPDGKFMDQKADNDPFKGIRKEK